MGAFIENTSLLVVTENGFGKRTKLSEYKVQTRGGKGVRTYRVTEKTGKLVGTNWFVKMMMLCLLVQMVQL